MARPSLSSAHCAIPSCARSWRAAAEWGRLRVKIARAATARRGEADGGMADLKSLRTIDAIREAARRRLPRGLFEFIDRGSEDERALARDPAAYDRILLRPRLLRGVAGRSAECAILGRAHGTPLAIAPTGTAGLVWRHSEIALARAAAKAAIPFTVATWAMSAIETVAAEIGARAEVFIGGGVRRGADVARALALGAKAVLVGRATLYGAAIGGEEGAARVIDILRGELLHARAMLGCATIDEIGACLVRGESLALSNAAGGER